MAATKRKSTTTKSSTAKSQSTDGLTLLKHDHDEVKAMFSQFEKSKDDAKKQQLCQQVCMELTIHAQLEEQSFYPLVKTVEKMEDMIMESLEEHRQVKELIAKLQGLRAGDEHMEPDMKVLKEDVEHHVEEEEKDMFPKLRKAWDTTKRKQLGESLTRAKAVLKREVQGGHMPGERRVTEEVRDAERVPR